MVSTRHRSRSQRLPSELLYELVTFTPYGKLENGRKANSRLSALGYKIGRAKHKKLITLYFFNAQKLSTYFHGWNSRVAAIRKFLQLREPWIENNGNYKGAVAPLTYRKKDIWVVNRCRLAMRGLQADLRKLLVLLREMSNKLHGALNMDSRVDLLEGFRISEQASDQFRSACIRIIQSASAKTFAEFTHLAATELPRLEQVLEEYNQVLVREYPDEVVACESEFLGCVGFLSHCDRLLEFIVEMVEMEW